MVLLLVGTYAPLLNRVAEVVRSEKAVERAVSIARGAEHLVSVDNHLTVANED